MVLEKINPNENLRKSYPKINAAIDTAEKADGNASVAKTTAEQALSNSEQTQNELTQAILAGDSSPLGGQLSVGSEGTIYEGPQERLIAEYNKTNALLEDLTGFVKRKEMDIWDFVNLVSNKPDPLDPNTWDWTPALQEVANKAVNNNGKVKVTFPTGIYNYTQSPNWGISNLWMEALGEVILRNTTTNNIFIMDASPDGIRRYYENIHMEGFIIEGHANALSGFYRRNIVRSTFKNVEVREMNSASGKAFHFLWGVSNNHYDLKHSVNSHNSINMAYDALFISNTDVGGDKSTNETYLNVVMEGSSIGIRLFVGDNHNFIGGTSEGNKIYGVVTGAETRANKFIGMAMEANGTADIADSGKLNDFDGCYTQKDILIQSTAEQTKIRGGFHQKITIDANAKNPVIEDIAISQYTTGGAIVHNNNQTARIRNVKNWQTGEFIFGQTAMNPRKARTGITVGASPFRHTNTSQYPQLVNISGGTVTQILWGNGGDIFELYGATTKGPANGQFLVMPGDYIEIGYSAAPAMNYIPR